MASSQFIKKSDEKKWIRITGSDFLFYLLNVFAKRKVSNDKKRASQFFQRNAIDNI